MPGSVRHGGTSVDDRRVELRITEEGERMHIAVSDQGKGFPKEVLDDLNDPENRHYSGLFNVSKRLVSVYGPEGRLHVESSPMGSTVSFSIPIIPPAGIEKEAEA